MNTLRNTVTPRQMPRPIDFMLGPSDWRARSSVGGKTGKFVSKAERFPAVKSHFGECVAPAANGTMAHANAAAGKGPNSGGAAFRSKTPQRPPPKRPLGDLVTTAAAAADAFGGPRARSPATSCFKASGDRFSARKLEGNASLRESVRRDRDVLQYQGVTSWKPASQGGPGAGSAAYRSKSDRFPKPRALAEFTGPTPVITPRGASASVARGDRAASAWSKAQGHEVFLPG
jgi:hypothetical protein